MVRARQGDFHIVDEKAVVDVMSRAGNTLFPHFLRHILRGVIGRTYAQQILTGGAAKMVVVDVCDQHGVQPGNLRGQDGHINQQIHIKALQQRVDHHYRPPAVEQDARASEPAHDSIFCFFESIRFDRNGFGRHGLPLCTLFQIHNFLLPYQFSIINILYYIS